MLPDDQCEQLRRTEMNALRMLLAHLSSAQYFVEDMQDRLKCIPDGNRRIRMAVGLMRAVCDDLCGTVTRAQAKQIYGTMKDCDLRIVPKLSPGSVNVILTKEEGKDLMDMARDRCHNCVEDGNSCRECRLYQILEATTPMQDYGDGLLCPYSLAQWEE